MKKLFLVLLLVSLVIPLTSAIAEHSSKDTEIRLAWLPPWSPDPDIKL